MRIWPRALADEIEDAFAFLLPQGYRLIAKSAWGMGGRVTYRSAQLWIGIEWDRSEPWLDFAPVGSAEAYDWDLVDHLLRGARHFSRTKFTTLTARVPELASFLQTRLADIEASFKAPMREPTIAHLHAVRAERGALAKEWWDGLKRPKSQD